MRYRDIVYLPFAIALALFPPFDILMKTLSEAKMRKAMVVNWNRNMEQLEKQLREYAKTVEAEMKKRHQYCY